MHSPEAPYIHTSTITRLARKVPEALFTPANTKARLARQVLSLRYKHPLEYAAKAATPEEKKKTVLLCGKAPSRFTSLET